MKNKALIISIVLILFLTSYNLYNFNLMLALFDITAGQRHAWHNLSIGGLLILLYIYRNDTRDRLANNLIKTAWCLLAYTMIVIILNCYGILSSEPYFVLAAGDAFAFCSLIFNVIVKEHLIYKYSK